MLEAVGSPTPVCTQLLQLSAYWRRRGQRPSAWASRWGKLDVGVICDWPEGLGPDSMMPSPARPPLLLLINGMFKEAVHQEAGHAVVKGCPVSDTRHVRLNSYELHQPHSTDRETEAQEPGNDPACPCPMLATATTAQGFGHQDGGHGARGGGEGLCILGQT